MCAPQQMCIQAESLAYTAWATDVCPVPKTVTGFFTELQYCFAGFFRLKSFSRDFYTSLLFDILNPYS